ncbi:unnamed protein product, partial [Prorocentrum cordatum]
AALSSAPQRSHARDIRTATRTRRRGGGAGGGGGGGGGGGRARWGLAGHGGRPPALACAEGRRRLSGRVQSMAVLFSRSPPEPQRRRAPAAPIWRGGARAPRNDGQSAASSAPVRLKYSNYSIPSEFSIELTTCG